MLLDESLATLIIKSTSYCAKILLQIATVLVGCRCHHHHNHCNFHHCHHNNKQGRTTYLVRGGGDTLDGEEHELDGGDLRLDLLQLGLQADHDRDGILYFSFRQCFCSMRNDIK